MALTLEVRHFQLVQHIADTGSVTRAADRLHLTQSALSHQLRDIESRLDARLFLRLGRRMALTPAGEKVLATARRVLADVQRVEDDLRAMADEGQGVLRLCTQCNTGYHWLPPLLETFHRKYPRVHVEIVVNATDRPFDALLEGAIDLAMATDEVTDPRLRTRPLFEDEWVAVVGPAHPLWKRAFLEPADLADQHLIIYRADRRGSFTFTRILAPAGVEPARVSQVPLTEAILELARAGLGVGVLARWAIEPAIKARTVRALPITRKGTFRTWTAVTLRDRPEPKWQREFVDMLAARALPVRLARAR
jgi:LysR family transcriptional regulator for metE and metH